MYDLYKKYCEVQSARPVSIYRNIFDTKYNLSFHKPTKEQCSFCATFKNASNEEKQVLQNDYEAQIVTNF